MKINKPKTNTGDPVKKISKFLIAYYQIINKFSLFFYLRQKKTLLQKISQ